MLDIHNEIYVYTDLAMRAANTPMAVLPIAVLPLTYANVCVCLYV